MSKRLLIILITLLAALPLLAVTVQAQSTPEYLAPRPGASLVSPGTTIAVRYGPPIDAASLREAQFVVGGSSSGAHSGELRLAADERTVIFVPALPFALGETISVRASGLRSSGGQRFGELSYSFTIRAQPAPPSTALMSALAELPDEPEADRQVQAAPKYLTAPPDFPDLTITVPASGTAPGELFMVPFSWGGNRRPFLLILDNSGEPIFYRPMITGTTVIDFKPQVNGQLTYFDGSLGYFVALDGGYNMVDTHMAGNGYPTDAHELVILPNGHAMLMIYDPQTMDMSQIAAGGSPTATVVGLVLQELDTNKNVVFEWRSWDHFYITDTVVSLTTQIVDYVHGNSIEEDTDGNWIISSRHLNEITKINRQTGAVMWRMGGKRNEFTFVGDPQMFAHQHDARRLANGHLLFWDNRNTLSPQYSRAVEYELDEVNKVVTRVWEYRNTPDAFASAMGSARRQPNGNTLTGWGTSYAPSVIEVRPDNTKAFELHLPPQFFNYRAIRASWSTTLTTTPTLVVQREGVTTTLAYSWNGATDIASYQIFAGDSPTPTTMIATQARTGFEDRTTLLNVQNQYCYYRVMPIDTLGRETRFSNEVYTAEPCRYKLYYPFFGHSD